MNSKTIEQPYQELFNYLANELNVIALQTQMQEIEAIIMAGKTNEMTKETFEESAEKYCLELLEAKTIQAHEKTWIKSMFIHIAKWKIEQICNHNYILTAEQSHRIIECTKCNHSQAI